MKMNPHYFLCLLRSGYFSPHRHKSAPHTKTLNQTIIITRLPYVQKQLSRVQPLYIRFLHRKQIQIHTIIKRSRGSQQCSCTFPFNTAASFSKETAISSKFRQPAKYAIACNSRYINAFKKMDPELP